MLVMDIVETKRLSEHKHRVREIRRLQEEINIISSKLGSPGGVRYSDMPRSQNPFDKMGMLVSRKLEKEKQLSKIMITAQKEAGILEKIIQQIAKLPEPSKGASNALYQDILRYYYLHDLSIQEIIYLINADNDDLIDNYDNELRLLYKRQDEALRKFIKCQKI